MEALINRVALMLANGVEESEACLYLVENGICDADTAGLAIVASRLFLKWANEPVKEEEELPPANYGHGWWR
jgi:hypothetical protein